MADAVASFALENLTRFGLENLKSLLIHEVNLFRGVKGDVKLLEKDLRILNAFLKDSAGKGDGQDMVKELINQIRDTAFEAEDVINSYMAHVIMQRRRKLLVRLLHCFDHPFALRRIAKKANSIKSEIDKIYADKLQYGIEAQSHVDEEAQQSLQERRRNVEEEDVVGFEHETSKLVHQLTDQQRSQREVISIVGMGGLGKTTLATKIYNNTYIKNHFDHCVWVNVYQEYKIRMLILDILKCVGKISEETYIMSDEQLKVTLRDSLKGKRYFVIMDDVWKPQLWDEIRASFPNDSNGSRILITSREKEVASNASPTPPHFLPFLDEEESWQLLCKKAFRGKKCPSNLESLGRKLAESCKGLPLSIVVLGGILANTNKTHQAWSSFVGNVNWFLIDYDKKCCSDILALSYKQLPCKLRLCFLYVGVFPEDYVIPARTLIQMWVAEGFISTQNDSRKMEEMNIAEYYLEGLIDQSLIQVASRRSDGGVKTCHIHDLLRDFCIKMSIEERFYEVRENKLSSSNSNPRRLSIIPGNIDSSESISSSNTSSNSISVGSLLFFTSYLDHNPLEWALKNFRFIRLLSFGDLVMSHIPKEIGQLVFLRYLKISSVDYFVRLESIPASICKLPYLETIHVEAWIVKCMPNEIWMMKQLGHLQTNGSMKLPQPPSKGDHTLSKLQVLSGLEVDEKTAILFQKSLFPNLRKVHLFKKPQDTTDKCIQVSTEMLASLESLQYLEILKLWRFEFGQPLDLFPSSSKLTKITLAECRCYDDCNSLMRFLRKLANLRILKIESCVMWSAPLIHFMAGEFPQLEVFKMIDISYLETWELETHAMPNLQHLVIHGCADLGNLPDELWSLENLRMVKVSGPIQQELKEKLNMIKQSKMEDGYSCKLIIN